MRRCILVCFLASFGFISKSTAQIIGPNDRISMGLELGLPIGDFSTFYDRAIGFSAGIDKQLSERFYLTGRVGYQSFNGSIRFGNSKLKRLGEFVPVKLGAKYFLAERMYGAGELGMAISSKNAQGGVSFAYAPTIGRLFKVSDQTDLDVAVRYEVWVKDGSSSFLGLRTALSF